MVKKRRKPANKSQRKFPVVPSPLDTRDWVAEMVLETVAVPDNYDLRPELFPVRDQGNQGSCAAMAGAAMKEYQEWVDISLDEYLSPQFIYNNREDQDSEGMYMRDLMAILKRWGDCREAMHQYGDYSEPSAEAMIDASYHLIDSYASVHTVLGLKQALYTSGPCVIAVPVYNTGPRMWHPVGNEGLLGGHAMCVVGYDTEGFIIRNSWGSRWNGDGYCTFPYTDWGDQWEVWTTVDADTVPGPRPEPPTPEPGDLWRYWPWALGVGALALILWLWLR